ncbi:MAG: hypothetical protein IJ554_05530 [Paludibacteraceae bacterium]|nr:hypothetical protein [Paludibacteraceae bacterium]MBR1381917.1 hypothetical protein [Paludibacteraceae bacterium]
MDKTELISLGYLKRTHNRDLPKFIFVQRDGLFVPFRSEEIASLMGEEIWVKRSDIQEEDDGLMTWQDLVGFTIEDAETGTVGTIETLDESTINTLATLSDGRMVPLHEDFILEIDEEQRVLHVHFPFSL